MINCMTREELDEVIESLEQTPTEVSLLLDQISPHEQRIKNGDDFSALENICHLRDIELEGYTQRIQRILNEDMPSLVDIDGSRLALERDYNNQNAPNALEAFSTARKRNIEQLRRVIPEQTAREGNLEGVGVITLARLLEMMLEHDQGHVIELSLIQRRFQIKKDASSV
jgi:DinB family protein